MTGESAGNDRGICGEFVFWYKLTYIENNTGLVSILIELHTTRELGRF